ncbi:hypothetical protein NDU88_012051, partial [Pleurodeles waltl]
MQRIPDGVLQSESEEPPKRETLKSSERGTGQLTGKHLSREGSDVTRWHWPLRCSQSSLPTWNQRWQNPGTLWGARSLTPG